MTYWEPLAAVTLAWVIGFLPMLRYPRWTWLHGLAAAALLYPALRASVDLIELAPLIGRFTVLQPYPPEVFPRIAQRIVERNLGWPLVGLGAVAVLGGAAIARNHLRPLARAGAHWRRELWLGLAIAPLFVLAEGVALLWLAGPGSFLQTGDESALFANATWWHVALLCIVPAFAEELYYRGLLQGLFDQLLPGPRGAWWAIGLQGLVFGLAHAGFLTVSHILGPLLFGLAMGYVRSVVGLGATMVCHASVNLFFFAVDPGAGSALLLGAAALVTVVGLGVLAFEARTLLGLVKVGPERDVIDQVGAERG